MNAHEASRLSQTAYPVGMRPLLLGHRGSPRLLRENTIPSFQAALDAGLDGVEWDVRCLGDNTLVIHHDAALADGRPLNRLTRPDLPDWLPTLTNGLAWAADTGAQVNIELKFEGWTVDDRVERTLNAVRGFGLRQRVIVSSFNPLQLRRARETAPEIERGLLIHLPYPLPLLDAVMRWTGAVALHPDHRLTDAELVRHAQRRGGRVNVWTVNEETERQRLVALGVDGLIGDVPEVLLATGTGRNGSAQ